MRFALFTNTGIGNLIFLLPLANALSKKGSVDLISDSVFQSEKILDGISNHPFDNIIPSHHRSAYIKAIAASVLRKYDIAFLDYFSSGRKNLIIANCIARQVVTNRIPAELPGFALRKVRFCPPAKDVLEFTQYMRFINPDFGNEDLRNAMPTYQAKKAVENLPSAYITIQPGTGNNETPWKTWPVDRFRKLIELVGEKYPSLSIVLIGDENEKWLAEYFSDLENTQSLVGRLKLEELPGVIAGARAHIGGDSGPAHVAGIVGTPSVVVFGATDPKLLSWHFVDPEKHKCLASNPPCHPCYRPYLPNHTRVSHPSQCPDFNCIKSIQPEQVFAELVKLMQHAVVE
ncbi:MAG: hypothetical protein Kow0075_01990 [Salibacteraceae bacterium]